MTNKVKFTSPFGTARHPHISSPDTKGKYADDKYKTKLVMPLGSPEAQGFIQQIKDAAVSIHGAKGLTLYMPFTEDEDANEAVFIFKTNYAPAIFDSSGGQAKGVQIGAGSVLRTMGVLVEFEKGISAQLNQVQIKELNGFGSCAFDAVEDGYKFDSSDVRETFAGNDTPANEGATDSSASALDI